VTGPLSRRHFLAGSAAATLAGAACSRGGGGNGPGDDLAMAAAAAGVENMLVDAYTDGTERATTGQLGAAVPPAVMAVLTTGLGHHQQARNAWNKMLTGAGRAEVTAPTAKLRPAVDLLAIRVTDILGLAGLALRLEDYAARTYQRAIPSLTTPEAIRLAAQLTVTNHQRQAVLRYILGLPPVGSGLAKTGATDLAPDDPDPRLLSG